MLWLDEFFLMANEKLPELVKMLIGGAKKSKKEGYKQILASYSQMNLPEKALNYIGFNNAPDATSMMLGGIKEAYLAMHILLLFQHCLNRDNIDNSVFEIMKVAAIREGIIFDGASSHAIKATTNLLNDFVDTKAPNMDLQEVFGDDFYYIEFPRSFLFCGKAQALCAFVHKTHIMVVGEDKFSRYGYDIVLYEPEREEAMTVGGATSLMWSFTAHRDDFVNIIKMIVLYYKSSDKKQRVISFKHNKNSSYPLGKKYKKQIKGVKAVKNKVSERSSFKLTYLGKPQNNESWRKKNTGTSKWHLDRVIQVKGHWRWQPHGKEKAERKLIYIQEYKKGSGKEDERAKMDVV